MPLDLSVANSVVSAFAQGQQLRQQKEAEQQRISLALEQLKREDERIKQENERIKIQQQRDALNRDLIRLETFNIARDLLSDPGIGQEITSDYEVATAALKTNLDPRNISTELLATEREQLPPEILEQFPEEFRSIAQSVTGLTPRAQTMQAAEALRTELETRQPFEEQEALNALVNSFREKEFQHNLNIDLETRRQIGRESLEDVREINRVKREEILEAGRNRRAQLSANTRLEAARLARSFGLTDQQEDLAVAIENVANGFSPITQYPQKMRLAIESGLKNQGLAKFPPKLQEGLTEISGRFESFLENYETFQRKWEDTLGTNFFSRKWSGISTAMAGQATDFGADIKQIESQMATIVEFQGESAARFSDKDADRFRGAIPNAEISKEQLEARKKTIISTLKTHFFNKLRGAGMSNQQINDYLTRLGNPYLLPQTTEDLQNQGITLTPIPE